MFSSITPTTLTLILIDIELGQVHISQKACDKSLQIRLPVEKYCFAQTDLETGLDFLFQSLLILSLRVCNQHLNSQISINHLWHFYTQYKNLQSWYLPLWGPSARLSAGCDCELLINLTILINFLTIHNFLSCSYWKS